MFEIISSTIYNVGRAIRRELFHKIVTNLNDLDSRVTSLSTGANKIVIWSDAVKVRANTGSLTGLDVWKSPLDFTLLDAKVAAFEIGGAAGILSMDVEKSPDLDPGNFVSVFSTLPSLDYGLASDYDESTNGVFEVTEQSVSAGDWLKLSFPSLPTPIGIFGVYLIGEIN